MRWHTLQNANILPAGACHARARVGPDSPWFSGHFPEDPVLPGIAQLSMVLETLRSVYGALRVTGIRRVRFKQVLRPGDPLEIMVKPNPGGEGDGHAFQIKVGEDIACSGIMTVECDRPVGREPNNGAL